MPSFSVNRIGILASATVAVFFVVSLYEIFLDLSNRRLPASEIKFVAKTFDFVLTKSKTKETNLPKVAWFLSYPNSGTTYTQTAVQQATQSTVASFYGREFLSINGISDWRDESILAFEDKKDGPFRVSNENLPSGGYILSKTHCGGFCSSCMPAVLTPSEFLKECTFASRVERTDREGESQVIYTQYDPSIVEKAVHLIRNPFDNVIGRFNFEHVLNERNSTLIRWNKLYTKDQAGFKEWCRHFDQINMIEESTASRLDKELMEAFKNVPCHGEFFRYIQWHNNALNITYMMGLPTHLVYYEDFQHYSKETMTDLTSFLELSNIGEVPVFKMKKYDGYYSNEEETQIMSFLKYLSADITWQVLNPYLK